MTEPREPRRTWQRGAIADALRRSGQFTTAQQLHDELARQARRVGLTTVYRELQNLTERGAIDVLRKDDGEAMYRWCESDHHHHHLVCRSCGSSVEIHSDELEDWAERTARQHGFVPVDHTAEIYGLCSRCAP